MSNGGGSIVLRSIIWPLRTRWAWTGNSHSSFLIQSMFDINLLFSRSLLGLLSLLQVGKLNIITNFKKGAYKDFPGGPVVKIPSSECRAEETSPRRVSGT